MIKLFLLLASASLVHTNTAIVCSEYEESEMDDVPVCTKQLWLEDPDCNCAEMKSGNDDCDAKTEMIQMLQDRVSMLEQSNFTAEQRISVLEENLRNLERNLHAMNCDDIYARGVRQDGVYSIVVGGKLLDVYCEIQGDGRNWLLFQKRFSGDVDFNLNWIDYQNGFGEKHGEFWLGLDILHEIVSSGTYMLRVDLEDWDGNTAFAEYSIFQIGHASTNYRLTVGGYSGTAGDSLKYHNYSLFSTKDRDNDDYSGYSCSISLQGAWWYKSCHHSNLNGLYFNDGQATSRGMVWYHWKPTHLSLKRSEMKIRRTSD